MKVVLDTSVVVEIDREDRDALYVVKKLVERNHEILVSAVTVSEILAGPYLRRDYRTAINKVRRILGQFMWIDLDGSVAEKAAQYIAYAISEGKPRDYQDIAIAATCSVSGADYLLTANKKHFHDFPELEKKVFTPKELRKKLGK